MKEVILYSGGMDSFILAYRYPKAKLLYIDSGAKYTTGELMWLHRLAPRQVHVVRNALDLSRWERDDAIVPARNLFLVGIASFYGDRVYLGSTAGDNSTDKDAEFCTQTGDVLSHIYDCHHFDRSRVSVEAPLKEWTKLEMVQWLQEAHPEAVDDMVATLSCYDPVTPRQHCGVCKACIRKWTALQAADINWWPECNTPLLYNWKPIIEMINSGSCWRSPGEDEYTMKVLKHFGVAR